MLDLPDGGRTRALVALSSDGRALSLNDTEHDLDMETPFRY